MRFKKAGLLFCTALVQVVCTSSASAAETVIFKYDALGRLIAVQISDGPNNGRASSYCFDAAGNRVDYKSDAGGALLACPGGSGGG